MPVVSNVKNALDRFPLEVWEKILEEVEDSRDIFNTLKAFPVLDLSPEIQRKKARWLFGMVFPILLEENAADLVEEDDDGNSNYFREIEAPNKRLLKLRLVCKHWETGVNNYLSSLPCFKVPSYLGPASLAQGPTWLSKEYSKCEVSEVVCFTVDFRGGPKPLTQQIAELDRLFPSERNPFVGGMLRISKDFSFDIDYYVEEPCETFEKSVWDALLELTRKWGKHISILMVSLDDEDLNEQNDRRLLDNLRVIAWENLLQLLGHLPNLKYFEFEGDTWCRYYLRRLNRLVIPQLPNLETLIFDKGQVTDPLLQNLIKKHAGTLRRLRLCHTHWSNELLEFQSNLTQLELTDIVSESAMKNVKDKDTVPLTNLLANLNPQNRPELTGLVLEFHEDAYEDTITERDVFSWIKQFPQLQSLELKMGAYLEFQEEGKLDPERDSYPSLNYLKITTAWTGPHYKFLKCFPSLQHLDINMMYPTPVVVDQSGPDTDIKFKEQLQTGQIYQSNIWELLPKLKVVIAKYHHHENELFCREEYDDLKREGGLPPFGEMFPYQHTMLAFIKGNAKSGDDDGSGSSTGSVRSWETLSENSDGDSEPGPDDDDGGSADNISDENDPDEDGNRK